MQLSIVIPVFNETDNVEPLLTEINNVLEGRIDYEVIFVDDASRDDTCQRLMALRRRFPRLRVVRHLRNSGQSAAILTGVRAARADWIATLDGDGQNDPADIPRLLAVRDDPAAPISLQLVTGYRRRRHDDRLRRLSSWTANAIRGRLLGDRSPDTGCGLKLFSREAFLAIPHFDHMHRFLPALIQRNGGTVLTVAVNHRPRRYGDSKYGLFDRLWVGIVDLIGVLWLQRRSCHAPACEEN